MTAFVRHLRTKVRHKNKEEKREKRGKKVLTKGEGRGNICKLSDERPASGREDGENHGKIRKKGKILLTSGWERDRMAKFTARA